MFYVLNFVNHSFRTCDDESAVAAAIEKATLEGTDVGFMEVVNCFSEDSRMSAEEFLATNQ